MKGSFSDKMIDFWIVEGSNNLQNNNEPLFNYQSRTFYPMITSHCYYI